MIHDGRAIERIVGDTCHVDVFDKIPTPLAPSQIRILIYLFCLRGESVPVQLLLRFEVTNEGPALVSDQWHVNVGPEGAIGLSTLL